MINGSIFWFDRVKHDPLKKVWFDGLIFILNLNQT